MKKWIVRKWDWWIYRRAHNSLRRMCKSDAGFAYLFELQLRDWLMEHPIPDDLARSTKRFYVEMVAVEELNKRSKRRNRRKHHG